MRCSVFCIMEISFYSCSVKQKTVKLVCILLTGAAREEVLRKWKRDIRERKDEEKRKFI